MKDKPSYEIIEMINVLENNPEADSIRMAKVALLGISSTKMVDLNYLHLSRNELNVLVDKLLLEGYGTNNIIKEVYNKRKE